MPTCARDTRTLARPDGRPDVTPGLPDSILLKLILRQAEDALDLDPVQRLALCVETGGGQRAAEAAAGIDGGRVLRHGEALVRAVIAARDHRHLAIGLLDAGEIARSPPQRVALFRQRPVGVETGMDEEQTAILGIGSAPHARQQVVMAGVALHRFAQPVGPAGDRQRAFAEQAARFLGAAAIGLQGRIDALGHHPVEDFAGGGRELQLQHLAPHLFLRAAQVDEVFRLHARQQHAAAEVPAWVRQWAQLKHGLELAAATAQRLLERLGNNLGQVDQALARLAAATDPLAKKKVIPPEAVDDFAGTPQEKTAWSMIDSAAAGKAAEAIRELSTLLCAGESPVGLSAQAAAVLRRLSSAARLLSLPPGAGRPASVEQALREAGVAAWPQAMNQAREALMQLGARRARSLPAMFLELDCALKGDASRGLRAQLALERLFCKMSRQDQSDRPRGTTQNASNRNR